MERSIALGRWVTLPGESRPRFIPSREMIEQLERERIADLRRKTRYREAQRIARALVEKGIE